MDREENLVFRHLLDLAKLSFARDISVFLITGKLQF